MSIAEKAVQIKELVSLIVTILPKIVDLIVEICSLLKEVKTNA